MNYRYNIDSEFCQLPCEVHILNKNKNLRNE